MLPNSLATLPNFTLCCARPLSHDTFKLTTSKRVKLEQLPMVSLDTNISGLFSQYSLGDNCVDYVQDLIFTGREVEFVLVCTPGLYNEFVSSQ